MSYYISMYFKTNISLEESTRLLNNFIIEYSEIENFKKVIEDNKYSIISRFDSCKIEVDSDRSISYKFYQLAILPLLSFKALYYPEFKLLGLCLDDCTGIIDKYFDGKIEFQNSCDQDYPYETWNILGDYFTTKAKEYTQMPDKEAIKLLDLLADDLPVNKENLEYCKRSALYQFVWQALDLSNWLYDTDISGVFIPLNINASLFNTNALLAFKTFSYFIELYEELHKND